jgi:hypothetical protein
LNAGLTEAVYTAILFLCSKEAKWITGLIMPVDGGVRFYYGHNPIRLHLTILFDTDHRRKGRPTSLEG